MMIRHWIEAIAESATALSAVFAALRYILVIDLPINLTLPNTIIGGTFRDGQPTSSTVSYNYQLRNFGAKDIQVGKLILQRRSFLVWHCSRKGKVSNSLPHRLPPNGEMGILITVGLSDVGTYRLIVREFSSLRRAKFVLPELRQLPTVAKN